MIVYKAVVTLKGLVLEPKRSGLTYREIIVGVQKIFQRTWTNHLFFDVVKLDIW
jgi:hypothetical protein